MKTQHASSLERPAWPKARGRRGKRGFTLLELLVATVVFSMVLLTVVQLTSATLMATRAAGAEVKTDRSIEDAMDLLAADFARAIEHDGQRVLVKLQPSGDAELALAVEGRRPTGAQTARLMGVRYVLENGRLVRKTGPVAWTANNPLGEAVTANMTGGDALVAEGVARFDLTARLADNSVVPLSAGASWTTNAFADGSPIPDGFFRVNAAALNPARALTIAIAAADMETTGMAGVSQLAASLPQPPQGKGALSLWSELLQQGRIAAPRPVLRSLVLSHRTLPMP